MSDSRNEAPHFDTNEVQSKHVISQLPARRSMSQWPSSEACTSENSRDHLLHGHRQHSHTDTTLPFNAGNIHPNTYQEWPPADTNGAGDFSQQGTDLSLDLIAEGFDVSNHRAQAADVRLPESSLKTDFDTLFPVDTWVSQEDANDPFGIQEIVEDVQRDLNTTSDNIWPTTLPENVMIQNVGNLELLHDIFSAEASYNPSEALVHCNAPNDPTRSAISSLPESAPGLASAHSTVGSVVRSILPTAIQQQQNDTDAVEPQQKPVASNGASKSRGKKRRRYDKKEREKVMRVRRLGSCLRCRIFKERCDESSPCERCLQVANSSKVFKQPCYRISLDAVHVFRAGDADHGQTRTVFPIMQWCPGEQVRTVQLQWPFKVDVPQPPTLSVVCQKFTPRPKDILKEEFFHNGSVKAIELPPYACKNTDITIDSMAHFMDECRPFLEEEIQANIDDDIVAMILAEVIRYRAKYETPIIVRALRMHAGAMLNSRYLTSIVADAFDLENEEDTPHYFQKLPLPPVLTYQIQGMIGMIMLKDQVAIIQELKKRIFRKDSVSEWYEIFLTIFVLLLIAEFVYQVQQRYLKVKVGITSDHFTRVSFATTTMLEEWEASARNLSQHFRCVVRGAVPFSLSWEVGNGNPQRAGLDDEATEFMSKLRRRLDERRLDLESLRTEGKAGRFEKPLAWICEMFLED